MLRLRITFESFQDFTLDHFTGTLDYPKLLQTYEGYRISIIILKVSFSDDKYVLSVMVINLNFLSMRVKKRQLCSCLDMLYSMQATQHW